MAWWPTRMRARHTLRVPSVATTPLYSDVLGATRSRRPRVVADCRGGGGRGGFGRRGGFRSGTGHPRRNTGRCCSKTPRSPHASVLLPPLTARAWRAFAAPVPTGAGREAPACNVRGTALPLPPPARRPASAAPAATGEASCSPSMSARLFQVSSAGRGAVDDAPLQAVDDNPQLRAGKVLRA